jgi:glycosyltransferase involved in cell wall biosynthesis
VTQKGQDLLLQVLSLPRWREREIRVSLVGKGVHERGLRRTAAELKLNNVEFTGFSNNIEEVWGRHHALVLASRYEGMPLALVEAMLCGRPCIVTDVGGNRELIRDGVNGFLAKAPTVELLDEAMNRAWENRRRLKEIGGRAASDVRQWVSRDPGEDFARELAAVADGGPQL